MLGIAAVLFIMTHEYNNRAKKDSAVMSESLQSLEDNFIKNTNTVKDEIINLKEAVKKGIKRLHEDNEKLRKNSKIVSRKLKNKLDTVETSLDALEQYGRRKNIVISRVLFRTLTLNQQ